MTKPPAFQFYPNDWLSSPHIAMMTPEQEGAYIRLLCYCWASGDCSLPSDEQALLSLSRLKDIDSLRVVADCFNQHPTESHKLVNLRLKKEQEKQEAWRKKSSNGGKQSAENKRNFKGGSRVVQPNVNTSFSSSSSEIIKKEKSSKKEKSRGTRLPEDWDLESEDGQWAMKEFGMSREAVLHEVDKFRDYWHGKAGQAARKVDWIATWRNWIRNKHEFENRKGIA